MAKSIVREKAMSKWTAVCLAAFGLLVFLSVSGGFMFDPESGQKHTGPVTVRHVDSAIEFIRPKGEFFETKFTPGWNSPHLRDGDSLKDLVYSDAEHGAVNFIKAVLDKEAPPQSPSDKILFNSGVSWMCSGTNICQTLNGDSYVYYLWSDGGYRDKPEKPSKSK